MQANLAGSLLFRSMRQVSSKRLDMLADFVRRKYLVRIECHCRRVSLMRSAGLAKSSSPSAHEIRPMPRYSSDQSILIRQPGRKCLVVSKTECVLLKSDWRISSYPYLIEKLPFTEMLAMSLFRIAYSEQ